MLCERPWHTGRERAHLVMQDGEADDLTREEDAVGKVCRGLDSGILSVTKSISQ